MIKKVLHIRQTSAAYPNTGISEAFESNGWEVSEIDWQKVKLNAGIEGVSPRLIAKAAMEEPDLIFIQMQNEGSLDSYTASELSKLGFTFFYTVDVRDNIDFIEELAPHLNLILFCDRESVAQLKEKGINNVDYMQPSCDTKMYRKFNNKNTIFDFPPIVFIGSNYQNSNLNFPKSKERQEVIEYMEKEFGDKFKAYGLGQKGGFLNPQEEILCYNSAKITFTQNNFEREGYCSDRDFRALACGIFTVHQDIKGLSEDFIYKWSNFKELGEICHAALYRDFFVQGAAKATNRLFLSNHTWSNRINQLEKIIVNHGFQFKEIQLNTFSDG